MTGSRLPPEEQIGAPESAALERAGVAVVVVDADGMAVRVNRAFEDLCESGEIERDRPWRSFLDRPERESLEEAILQAIAGKEERRIETRWYTRGGEARWVEWIAGPFDGDGGHPGSVILTGVETTARRAAEQELLRANEVTAAASRIRSEFIANTSHEIRTPMNGIIGMCNLLISTELDRDQKEYAEIIRSSAERLLTLTDNILDFAKVETGRVELISGPVHLHCEIGRVTRKYSLRAARKGIELICSIEPDVPYAVEADAGRLRQVLSHLVENAVKFTERGEVVVEVSCRPRDNGCEGVDVEFAVHDTGIGIPDGLLTRIFEPFSQADGSATRRHGGTGLGLSICSQVAVLMGGRIHAENRSGGGSSFRLTVPLRTFEGGPEAPPLQPWRVLVAEGHERVRSILCRDLASMGLRPEPVETLPRALEKLRTSASEGNPYPLAFLSARLEGIAAVEKPEETEFVLLVLENEVGPGALAEDPRFCGHLARPVIPCELIEALACLQGRGTGGKAARAGERWNILLAEDNPVCRALAVEALRNGGHQVTVVGDGRRALDLLARKSFDLVLLDENMPGIDGAGAVEILRVRELGSPARLPVWVLSACGSEWVEETGPASGADGVLRKPLDDATLRHAMAALSVSVAGGGHDLRSDPGGKTSGDGVVLDEDLFLERMGHDAKLMQEMIELFLSDGSDALRELKGAVDRGDDRAIMRCAHRLKGSLGSMAAPAAAAAARKLETVGREGNLGYASHVLSLLEREIERLNARLGQLAEKGGSASCGF